MRKKTKQSLFWRFGSAQRPKKSTNHALRYHPNGSKRSTFFNNAFVRFDVALENERWFERNFIPTGFFHDLQDFVNTNPAENNWDFVGGVSIRQMYNALTPQANNMCNYIDVLLSQNVGLNLGDLNNLYFENTDRALGCNF
jgi:hypothetical protein